MGHINGGKTRSTLFPRHLYAPNSTPSPSTSLSLSPVLSPPSSCACRLAGVAQSRLIRAARARGTGATCRKLAYLLNTSFSSNSCHTIARKNARARAHTHTHTPIRTHSKQVSTPHCPTGCHRTRATRPRPSACCATPEPRRSQGGTGRRREGKTSFHVARPLMFPKMRWQMFAPRLNSSVITCA